MKTTGFELVPTMRAHWAAMGPTDFEISPTDFRVVAQHMTIGDLAPRGPVVCCINGEWISRRDWWQPVREGDVIVFKDTSAIHGGENSNVLRTVLTVVVLIVAAYYGGPLAGELGIGGVGSSLTAAQAAGIGSALITVGGTLLVNAILPNPSQAGGFTGQQAISPTYSIGGSGNTARLGQSIPVRYGQEFVYPDFACQPYAEYDAASDQFFCAVLCLGYGQFNILQVSIEDTDIRSFQDVQVLRVGPGQQAMASPFPGFETLDEQTIVETGMVVAPEVGGASLESTDWVGGYATVAAGRQTNRIFFDFVYPEGIGSAIGNEVVEYSVTLQFSVRTINDYGQPTGAWQLLGNVQEAGSIRQPIRRTYAYDVPPGRYQARVRRVLDVAKSYFLFDDASWVGLRSRLTTPGIQRDDCTYLVVRMRANEQLSNLSQRRIGILAQRLIPIYNVGTQTWSAPTFTRNPAHAFADILHDTVEGRGLPDSRIDHDTLADLAARFTARQDRFDYSFDTRRTFHEALQLVARAGRARPLLRRGAVYTMVRDEQQAAPVAMFMPRNMQADSFSMAFRLANEDSPDCVRLEFRSGARWGTDYVYAQRVGRTVIGYYSREDGAPLRPPGVPAPTLVQDERLAGVIGRTHALREAMFLVADSLYRPISCDWKAELDGLLPTIGSLVGIAHDVAAWAQSGDVANLSGLMLETTEPLSWTPGQTHYVRLQTSAGGAGLAIAVTQGPDDHTMVLASPPAEAPVFDSADRERTRYLFGSLADVTRYVRIKRISPESQYDIALAAVLEDNRVHAIDQPLLPTAGQVQDPLSDGSYTSLPGDGGTGPGGGSTGAGIPVTIYSESIEHIRGGGTRFINNEPTNIGFGNDGLFFYSTSGDGTRQERWLSLAPVSPGIAGLFEILFEDLPPTFGDVRVSSPPVNAWLPLDVPRDIRLTGTAADDTVNSRIPHADAAVRVSIRDRATAVVQAVAVFTYSFQVIVFN